MKELSATTRIHMLAEMQREPLDILVIGGGITGAGIAADAAIRGLRVGLVEQHDFASGTSSRSSKMIHGGLRYLATGDIALVREALRERALIARRAAYMVRPLPMMLPMYGKRFSWMRIKIGTGLWLYDMLGASRNYGRHRWLTVRDALLRLPNLSPERLLGSLAYHDAQADDVTLVLANIRTAVANGALVANRAPAVSLLEEHGRIVGAEVEVTPGSTMPVRAAVVVNAAGVWADLVPRGSEHEPGFELRPSKGIHLTVPRDKAGIESGVAFFAQTGNSNIFLEPWDEDLVFVGTSDTPYKGDLASPEATEDEIAFLLSEVNRFLRVSLTREDVISAWAGLRPLVVQGKRERTSNSKRKAEAASKDASRRHATVESPGLVTMVGGKLTTYRQMAEEAVDAAAKQIDRPVAGCTTRLVPLEGAGEAHAQLSVDEIVAVLGVDRASARHLARRYGNNVRHIIALVESDRELGRRLHPDRPYLRAEVVYAARYEMAIDVSDVLSRRTRLSIETRDGGQQAAADVAALLGHPLTRP